MRSENLLPASEVGATKFRTDATRGYFGVVTGGAYVGMVLAHVADESIAADESSVVLLQILHTSLCEDARQH